MAERLKKASTGTTHQARVIIPWCEFTHTIPRRAGKTGAPYVVNPSLIAHRLAMKDPRLALAGQSYVRIVR